MTILRVTDVLDANGLLDLAWVTEYGLARGSAVHKATALSDEGRLDDRSVHEAIAPYLESWRRFVDEAGVTVRAIEMEVRHEPLRYAGRLDRIVTFRGRHAEVIVDLKNGSPLAWHPFQTSGYAMAYAWMTAGPTPERGSVYLQPDGRAAKFVSHKDRSDFDEWKHLVAVAHLKVRLGIHESRPRTDPAPVVSADAEAPF